MKVVIIRDDIKLELKDIEVEEIYRYYDDELSNLYLYGETVKDAFAMGTVSLNSEQLKQYKEQYPVLINVKERIDLLNEGRDKDTF